MYPGPQRCTIVAQLSERTRQSPSISAAVKATVTNNSPTKAITDLHVGSAKRGDLIMEIAHAHNVSAIGVSANIQLMRWYVSDSLKRRTPRLRCPLLKKKRLPLYMGSALFE